jgi:hypothetical protein
VVSAAGRLRGPVLLAATALVASVARADAPGPQGGMKGQYGYFDQSDTTITDNYTGLTWQRYPAPTTFTFDQAAAYCQGLSLGAYSSGWRVPSYKELLTLVDEQPHLDYADGAPVQKAIDPGAFPGLACPLGEYWTSSAYGGAASGNKGYAVDFGDGTATGEYVMTGLYVRCVHD